MMIDIRKVIAKHYFFNNNKQSRKIIRQFIKHIIFVSVDYTNINLIFINAYKGGHVNGKSFRKCF